MVKFIVKSVARSVRTPDNPNILYLGEDCVCNEQVTRYPPIDSPERARRFDTELQAQIAADNFRRSFKDGPNMAGHEYHGLFGKAVIEPVEA